MLSQLATSILRLVGMEKLLTLRKAPKKTASIHQIDSLSKLG
jgi:hypothetical protein